MTCVVENVPLFANIYKLAQLFVSISLTQFVEPTGYRVHQQHRLSFSFSGRYMQIPRWPQPTSSLVLVVFQTRANFQLFRLDIAPFGLTTPTPLDQRPN